MKIIALNSDFSNIAVFLSKMDIELLDLWDRFTVESKNGFDYVQLERWQKRFKQHGLYFEYYLDSEPYEFVLTY